MTDSICCSVDTPYSNCASSGANDYIEVEGARDDSYTGFGVGHGNRQHFVLFKLILFFILFVNFSLNILKRFCGRWLGVADPTVCPPSYTYNAVNAAKTLCTQGIYCCKSTPM